MIEQIPRKDKDKKEPAKAGGALFGLLKNKKEEQEEVEFVTVREEKKRTLRVVKPKPKSRQHASEAFQAPAMTQEDIKTTERVMESVSPVMAAPPPKRERSFTCVQCGADVPVSAERCPGCRTHYLRGISERELRELELAEASQADDEDLEESFERDAVPVVHFDAESGIISYLESDDRDPDFMLECSHCGTAIQFNTDRCPICGTKLESSDTGIVGLFADMDFEWDESGEMECPSCGEHVRLVGGKCPACNEIVAGDRGRNTDKLDPVIHNENVVFLHFDVESGELNFLQRLARKLGFEQLTVQLDGIGKGGFDQDWQSLSRI